MYSDKWRQLRAWTYASWMILAVGIVIAFFLSSPSAGKANDYFVPCWFAAFAVVSGASASFKCPRCHRPFFKPNFLAFNGFANQCVHCGLPKWADGPHQGSPGR
jgi:hypothetical protein